MNQPEKAAPSTERVGDQYFAYAEVPGLRDIYEDGYWSMFGPFTSREVAGQWLRKRQERQNAGAGPGNPGRQAERDRSRQAGR